MHIDWQMQSLVGLSAVGAGLKVEVNGSFILELILALRPGADLVSRQSSHKRC